MLFAQLPGADTVFTQVQGRDGTPGRASTQLACKATTLLTTLTGGDQISARMPGEGAHLGDVLQLQPEVLLLRLGQALDRYLYAAQCPEVI